MTRVAVLIPSYGQRGLANLARDAIAAFTQDVPHDVFLLDHGSGEWPVTGSDANATALMMLAPRWTHYYTHTFLMHDDSLPVRAGWLSYLLDKPLPAGAIVSARSGRGHSAGTLFRTEHFEDLKVSPCLPHYDVAESEPSGWVAPLKAWRGPGSCGDWQPPSWMAHHECDVALADDGQPFFVHLGGGSIGAGRTHPKSEEHRVRIATWIHAARWALFDCAKPSV